MASEIGVQTIQHTNGTDAMTIDSSGRVQLPAIPCCHVKLTTSNSQDTSNPYTTTQTAVKFDSIILNQGVLKGESIVVDEFESTLKQASGVFDLLEGVLLKM